MTLITNLAPNPTAALNAVGWEAVNGTVIRTGTDTNWSNAHGPYMLRATATGAATTLYIRTQATAPLPATPGTWVAARCWVGTDTDVQVSVRFQFLTSTGASAGVTALTPLGVPGFYSGTFAEWAGLVPANATHFRLELIASSTTSGANLASGKRMWADQFMVVSGASEADVLAQLDVGYHDGDSSGWVWNGTPHASTSTGPSTAYTPDGWVYRGDTQLDYLDAIADFSESADSGSIVQTTLNTSGVRHHVVVRPSGPTTGTMTFHFTRELATGEPGARAQALADSFKSGAPHRLVYNADISGLSDVEFVATGAVERRLEVDTAHRKRQAVWTVTVDYTRTDTA